MDNDNEMNNGGQGDGLNGAPVDNAPMNETPVSAEPTEAPAAPVSDVPADNALVEAQPSVAAQDASAQTAEVAPAAPIADTLAQDAPVQDVPANTSAQAVPAPAPVATPAPAPAPTPEPMSAAGNPPVATAPKKSNSKLIVLVVSIVVVLVAVIVALVVILMNNNNGKSSKSQNNKGSSYYEEDEDKDDDDSNTGSASSISCMGYQFEKQAGYDYACEAGALEVSSSTFAVYLEVVNGLSYYQAEGHAEELATGLSEQGTVKGYRKYTTSSGRKMLVFDMTIEGVNTYTFVTAATSSSVLTGIVLNASGYVTTSDLEKADSLLSDSTISSRLPEGEAGDTGTAPTIDWNLKVPEL